MWLDARDLTAGALTQMVSRGTQQQFTGSATCDLSINGTPTVVCDGVVDHLRSAGNIAAMNGATAYTLFLGMTVPPLGSGYKVIAEFGSDYTTEPDSALIYQGVNLGERFEQYSKGVANPAVWCGTQIWAPPQPAPTTVPAVWVFQIDLANPAAPTCSFWRNNQTSYVEVRALGLASAAFGNHPLSLADRAAGQASAPSALSFTQCRMYASALSTLDREAISLDIAAASGIVFP